MIVPPPVWPPHTLRINFDSKHVASQVQKLSVLSEKNHLRKNPNFVSSVVVGQNRTEIQESTRGLGLSDNPTDSRLRLGVNSNEDPQLGLGLASRDFGLSGKE